MTSLVYLLGSNPVWVLICCLLFNLYEIEISTWNLKFKCVRQNACAVDVDLWGITLSSFSCFNLKVAAVSKMKSCVKAMRSSNHSMKLTQFKLRFLMIRGW